MSFIFAIFGSPNISILCNKFLSLCDFFHFYLRLLSAGVFSNLLLFSFAFQICLVIFNYYLSKTYQNLSSLSKIYQKLLASVVQRVKVAFQIKSSIVLVPIIVNLYISSLFCYPSIIYIKSLYLMGCISGLPVLIYLSVCLILSQYQTVSIIILLHF